MPKKKPLTAAEMQSMGGKARAASLTPERRAEIAAEAGRAAQAKITPADRERRRKALKATLARKNAAKSQTGS